ncbi:MAG: Glycosyltransferase [Ktedonobacterales bacterium]|nr:MAG: Glycosyltransferase [Ktedonobacterales bacterium]
MLHVAINAQLVSFAESYRNAGVSRYTYTLLEGLSAEPGDQHYTAFVNEAEARAAASSPLGVSGALQLVAGSWRTGNPGRRILWEQFALPGELRRIGAQVFHSPVNVLPARLPCASVVTVHDLAFVHYPQYFRPARRIYQRTFTRRSAQHATRIVAVSEHTKRDLIERFGAPEERVRVIYPAIGADFAPVTDNAERAAFRAQHGLPERYVLFLGTLEPRKNLPLLVEAYARLRSLDENTPPLVLAGGKGWYYQTIFDRIRALNMERHITFAGYVAREAQRLWYACAELFVYPSVYEGFGLPVVEALACGTPVITSNVSSMPEAGGTLAIQVAPDDADALAHAMRDALADPQLRERTQREGTRWAGQFSVARMAQAYEAIYREAAAAGGGQGKRGR